MESLNNQDEVSQIRTKIGVYVSDQNLNRGIYFDDALKNLKEKWEKLPQESKLTAEETGFDFYITAYNIMRRVFDYHVQTSSNFIISDSINKGKIKSDLQNAKEYADLALKFNQTRQELEQIINEQCLNGGKHFATGTHFVRIIHNNETLENIMKQCPDGYEPVTELDENKRLKIYTTIYGSTLYVNTIPVLVSINDLSESFESTYGTPMCLTDSNSPISLIS